jgi:hypothetical protein
MGTTKIIILLLEYFVWGRKPNASIVKTHGVYRCGLSLTFLLLNKSEFYGERIKQNFLWSFDFDIYVFSFIFHVDRYRVA